MNDSSKEENRNSLFDWVKVVRSRWSYREIDNIFVSDKESCSNVSAGVMPGSDYTGTGVTTINMRDTSRSPQSGTDADSAIGADADSSTSPELRHVIDFVDEKEETFTCFGENDTNEFDQR